MSVARTDLRTDMDDRPGAQRSNEVVAEDVSAPPNIDLPASVEVVCDAPNDAEDVLCHFVQDGQDEQVPVNRDKDEPIQGEGVNFSHLFDEGNDKIGLANLLNGGDEEIFFDSDDAASFSDEEYYSADEGGFLYGI